MANDRRTWRLAVAIALASLCVAAGAAQAGVLAYWDFDSKYASGSDEFVPDLSGSGQDGKLLNGADLTAGGGGHSGLAGDKALDLDGEDDLMSVPDGAAVIPLDVGDSSFSLSLWFQRDRVDAGTEGLLDHEMGGAPSEGYQMAITGGNDLRLRIDDGPDHVLIDSDDTITDNEWHHVVFSVDKTVANGVKIYLDGTQESTTYTATAIGDVSASQDLWFGRLNSASYTLDGRIDDVAIYSRALDAWEAKALSEGADPMNIPEPTTVGLLALGGAGLLLRRRRTR